MATKKKVVPIIEDKETCGHCKHFQKNDHDSYGYCYRYPPVVLPLDDGFTCERPVVESDETCGEFRRVLNS
jgi:hypothetical protein